MATQNPDRKIFAVGKEAQEKILKGVNLGTDIVSSTLGPAARNVLIERKFRTPICVDDGITALNNLILEDELENLGITSLIDAANHTSEYVGDGTSTTVVLTRAIYESGVKLTNFGDILAVSAKTPLEIKKEIEEAKKLVINELQGMAKKVETRDEIRGVAYAAYADDAMADTIADLVSEVGANGTVIVEEGWGRETEVERVVGMRFAAKMASGHFANTAEDGMNLENVPILVTDFDFVNLNDIAALVKEISISGEQNLVIVANKYERPAIDQVVKTNVFNAQNRQPHRIWLLRTPSFTPGEFEDFATFVGAKYFSKENGDKILDCKMEDLGRVSQLKISKIGDGIALGGAGTKEAREARIEELKKKLEDEKVKMLKARLEQRIASLAAAIGIIKVASPSDGETEHIRLKVRNAVKSSQSAVAEGMVRGGGLALKEIAEKLPRNILTEALKTPHKVIQDNAGGKLEIPENLFDPVKVTRTALEQACSQAWQLINTGTAIAFRTEGDRKDAAEIVSNGLKGFDPRKPSEKFNDQYA